MEKIFARRSVSLTELRKPTQIIKLLKEGPIAITNRNTIVGYLVPVWMIEHTQDYHYVTKKELEDSLKQLEERLKKDKK